MDSELLLAPPSPLSLSTQSKPIFEFEEPPVGCIIDRAVPNHLPAGATRPSGQRISAIILKSNVYLPTLVEEPFESESEEELCVSEFAKHGLCFSSLTNTLALDLLSEAREFFKDSPPSEVAGFLKHWKLSEFGRENVTTELNSAIMRAKGETDTQDSGSIGTATLNFHRYLDLIMELVVNPTLEALQSEHEPWTLQ
ncbi:uncharacterized protein B0I36DRAFT_356081 [Microdochium trichocladiopsis]|uniref:Uncharacterized protein n=1 Tax=Microdochium trichocladiopsis TaxID=1682393 RepID=A0A9P8XUJ3_9PEZI|nr:uncharacterized protein B0I36DRAFT_356081 [Microdochium trichocladiopsis]KAH7012710.1 hypothetical protein B0I36DRAFT_356081 [Microdochium trichocladiopsis]